ncbi:4-hydroxy-tetrahydrodipicolinate reductase [Gilvibacter sp.]|uniref:4-hydroxy-tetrahydrodipicolinate reductase n=1 Tax=Gilvibacter sp. TaxID=2729997 RepID=UPI003F4A3A18
MKIALLGYGKMGQTIERLAAAQGHEIVIATNDSASISDFNNAEVAIDFSVPTAAYNNIKKALESGIPVISGTTGWLEELPRIETYCQEKKGAFLYASNFSVGVNIFFAINQKLAELMGQQAHYEPSITEIHHTQKLDKPSGTAITLADAVLKFSQKQAWALQNNDPGDLWIDSIREGDVKGTHHVKYQSAVDTLTISHEAHSRDGFALGAIVAAKWIIGKQGVFSMQDVLNLS